MTTHEYDERGNRTQTIHRIPSIVEDFEYNEFGQRTAKVLPDNGSNHRRRDELTYYEDGPQRGYLHQRIVDIENLRLTTTYGYDSVGDVVFFTDPGGDETQFVVNQLDQIVRTASPEVEQGSGVRYERDYSYDANNNTMREDLQNIDEQGVLQQNAHWTTTYEYEILNHLVLQTEEVDPEHSIVTEYGYDGNRNLTLVRYGEATNGNQPANVLRALYDERDLLFREIRAEGDADQSTTQYDYDPDKNLITRAVGLEDTPRIFTKIYDGYNRLVEATGPMGNVMTYGYDANHNRVLKRLEGETRDGAGSGDNIRLYESSFEYDEMDRAVVANDAFFDTETQEPISDGVSTTVADYSDNSQMTRGVNDNGHEERVTYDTVNRVGTVTDRLDNVKRYTYDDDSNITLFGEIEKSDLRGADQVFSYVTEYDGLERAIESRDNVGNRSRSAFNSRNNRALEIDALGNVIRQVFDGVDRVVTTTRVLTDGGTGDGAPDGVITMTNVWDDTTRIVTQSDDNANTTSYAYDALNRRIATTYADGTGHSYAYDVHDNTSSMTDANGSVSTCTYDLLNRLKRKDIVPGPGVWSAIVLATYEYDGRSGLTRAEDDDSVVTRSYDSLSSVTREVLNGQTTRASYDGVGNRLTCTYPGGRTLTCAYDGLERKKTASDENGSIAAYDYVGPRRVERCGFGNGTRMEPRYDGITGVDNPENDFGLKQIIRTTHSQVSDSTVIDERTYTWDRSFNKTRREDVRPDGSQLVQNYEYDSVCRLVSATEQVSGGLPAEIEYSLDGVGDRTSVTGGPDAGDYTKEAGEPDPADSQTNQYTRTSFDSREYDLNGNLAATDRGLPSERTYTYDYRNQLVAYADTASGSTARYAYDIVGRRIERVVVTGTTSTVRYFYTDGQVCEEQDENKATAATYVYGIDIDEVVNMRRGGADFYYHCDELYNVVAITDSQGDVVERYAYADYGEPSFLDASGDARTDSAVGNTYLFTGRRFDAETGYYYYRSRYLDPRAGRFTCRDMLGIWADGLHAGNGYAYAGNNPINNRDPMGTQTKDTKEAERKKICKEAGKTDLRKDSNDDDGQGGVICKGGEAYACAWGMFGHPEVEHCILVHEQVHITQKKCPKECTSNCVDDMERLKGDADKAAAAECEAYRATLTCAENESKKCGDKPSKSERWRCYRDVSALARHARKMIKELCKKTGGGDS